MVSTTIEIKLPVEQQLDFPLTEIGNYITDGIFTGTIGAVNGTFVIAQQRVVIGLSTDRASENLPFWDLRNVNGFGVKVRNFRLVPELRMVVK